MTELLIAKNLQKKFTNPVVIDLLRGIDFTLSPGETVAILGASGQGKSTLLHILGTLEEPSSGTLMICGKKVTPDCAAQLRRQYIGFIFQAYHLLADETALYNVLMPAHIAGASRAKGSPAHTRALELLDYVGLGHRATFMTKLLSGGEKQRVAIARALMNDPPLLLADEPSGNLDRHTSESIHHLLIDAAKKQRKGLLVVTHNQELAALCDRRLSLHEGELIPMIINNVHFDHAKAPGLYDHK